MTNKFNLTDEQLARLWQEIMGVEEEEEIIPATPEEVEEIEKGFQYRLDARDYETYRLHLPFMDLFPIDEDEEE